MSLLTFAVIGLAVRWDTDGLGTVSLAGAMVDYVAALLKGHEEGGAEPLRFLAVWTAFSILMGWLVQRLRGVIRSSRERSSPSC